MSNDGISCPPEFLFEPVERSSLFSDGELKPLEIVPENVTIEDFIGRYLPGENMRSFPSPMQPMAPVLMFDPYVVRCGLGKIFSRQENDVSVLILKAVLFDFDVVYAAHVNVYGNIASTLQYVPGLETPVCVLFLEPEALLRLHESEGAGTLSNFVHLWDIRLQIEKWPLYFEAYTYLSQPGPLLIDEKPVGLKNVNTRGMRGPVIDQFQMQSRLYEKVSGKEPDGDVVKRFMAEQAGEKGRHARDERNRLLKQHAGNFNYRRYEIMPVSNRNDEGK